VVNDRAVGFEPRNARNAEQAREFVRGHARVGLQAGDLARQAGMGL
jgi:hypothetical protein